MCGLLSSDGSGNGGSKSGVVEYPRCVLMYAQREGVSAGGAMRSAGEALLGSNLQPDRERKLMVPTPSAAPSQPLWVIKLDSARRRLLRSLG